MDLGDLERGYDLLKRTVVVGVIAAVAGVGVTVAAVGAAVAARSLAPLVAAVVVLAAFQLYLAWLMWQAFSIFHANYGHKEFRLAKRLVLLSAAWTVAAAALLSVWLPTLRPGMDPSIAFLASLASWTVGVALSLLWLKVYGRLAEASGVDYFSWVGYAGVAAAVLDFAKPLAALISIVSLVLLYIAAREATYRLQEARR